VRDFVEKSIKRGKSQINFLQPCSLLKQINSITQYGGQNIMKNKKFNTLTLIGVFIGSILMGMNAFEQYQENHRGDSVIFIILSIFLFTLAAYGIAKNRRVSR
jgi:uncharacterized membrane protein